MANTLSEDRSVIESIVRQARVCRVAFAADNQPYVVPVCFGYQDGVLYFHCSKKGRKIDMLRENGTVCFEMDVDFELVEADTACEWSVKYRSVVGFGTASLVDDVEEKKKALDAIMAQYSDRPYTYPEKTVERTGVVRIDIARWTAKSSA